MKNKYDVVSLGELLIDFTMNGITKQNNQQFEANPGGAPCNVLAMLSQLGKCTAFIGKVGNDQFGKLLKQTLESISIDTENLVMDEEINTTLAFVHTLPDGDRDFSFYRNPGADMMLREDEVKTELIEASSIFHFGTLSLTHTQIRNTTNKAIAIAKKSGILLSFDPNLRPPLWENLVEAKEQMLFGMSQCDIMKISDNEIEFVTGKETIDEGIRDIREQFPNIKLILATLGKDGSIAYTKNLRVYKPGFLQKNIVDTTGAGDTFCGCVLGYLLEHNLEHLSENELFEMLTFANAAASLITTKKGAICSMPTKEEVIKFMKSAQ